MTTRTDPTHNRCRTQNHDVSSADGSPAKPAADRPTVSPAATRMAARADREAHAASAPDGGAAPHDAMGAILSKMFATPAASGSAETHRVDQAKAAVVSLARELPGHGVDTDALAARFAGPKFARMSDGEVAAHARMDFVRTALTNHPELADAMIAVRLRGQSSERSELARLACASSGARGWAKYAECEKAISRTSGLAQQELRELTGMVRAGMSLSTALATQKQQVAQVDAETASRASRSLRGQENAAIGAAQAQGAACKRLLDTVNQQYRKVPNLTRGAEFAVGIGAGLGTVGTVGAAELESLLRQDQAPLVRAFDQAENAGGYMAGELTDQIRAAQGKYTQFHAQYAEYASVNQQYQAAVRNQDHAAIVSTSRRLAELVPQLKATAGALGAQAESIGKQDKEFDGAAVHAAIHLAVSAVTMGIGGFPGEHAVADGIAIDVARSLGPDAGVLVGEAAAASYATTGEGVAVRVLAGAAHH